MPACFLHSFPLKSFLSIRVVAENDGKCTAYGKSRAGIQNIREKYLLLFIYWIKCPEYYWERRRYWGGKKLCFLRLNHRKWNKCQKVTTNWFCLILALPRSGCTACWAHLPQEHDELYGRLRISRWERSRLSLSENILSLFWRAFKWTWSLIGRSDEDCSTSGSSWVQSRRSADGFLIFCAVRRLLGFEPKDRFCLTSELFSLSKRK